MDKFLTKPTDKIDDNPIGKFEKFNLKENPFPSNPFVNRDSSEAKVNGSIFEIAIRDKEYKKIMENFLQVPQSNDDHFRLGFINDTSYIGRGNGKSAFLIYLMRQINENYCLDISKGVNKCFAIYVTPEGGGKVKTFEKFVDLIFHSMVTHNIIATSLALLRLEVMLTEKMIKASEIKEKIGKDEEEIISKLNSGDWFRENKIELNYINRTILKEKLGDVPKDFPINSHMMLFSDTMGHNAFEEYYANLRGQEKYDFVFTHLVSFFSAAGFNGAYIFVDDFERIPDFQSAVQRKDFATQLRTVLFDGAYKNSKIGFYNFLLALHAGVPKLIEDAWSTSGMEQRVPINPTYDAKNIVAFEKLGLKQAVLLIKKYLSEFRIKKGGKKAEDLEPFDKEAIELIGQICEYNAAKILKYAYYIIDQAATEKAAKIDKAYVQKSNANKQIFFENKAKDISSVESIDLEKKAGK